MASPAALRQALELSASNFRPRNADQWVEDMATTWIRHPTIAGASDDAVERAIIEHMGNSQFAPKLSDVVALLKQGRPVRLLGSTGPACPDCSGTGWREGSALLRDGTIEGPVALVCGCAPRRGVLWGQWADRQGHRRDVERYWITGRDMPQIPDEGRLTADQIAYQGERATRRGQVLDFRRQPEDPHAALRARQEKELKQDGWR